MRRGDFPSLYHLLFLLCLILLLVPVWVVDFIPLPDVPINMARAYMTRHFGDGSPVVSHLDLSPHLLPNSAFELLVPPLLGAISLERATQCFLTFYLLLFAAGCHWLGRAVQGGDHAFGPPHFAALPCLFLSYQSPFLYGYLNYSAGLALAILTLALRIGWGRHWTFPRLATLTLLSLGVYLFHLSAEAILALGWAAWSVWEIRQATRLRWWDIGSFLAFIPAGLLYLQTDRGGGGVIKWASPIQKVIHLLGAFTSYSLPVTAFGIAAAGGAFLLMIWLSRRKFIQPAGIIGVVFLGVYLLAPDEFHRATDTDTRFVAPTILLLSLACLIPSSSLRSASILLGISMAAMTIRQVDIVQHWRMASAELVQYLPSLDVVPRGSVLHWIVPVNPDPRINKRNRHFYSFAALASFRRQAEIPNFAHYPKGTWRLSMEPVYTFCHLEYEESPSRLDWKRLRNENAYLWTYGLSAPAAEEISARAVTVYSSGSVRVFHATGATTKTDTIVQNR